MDASTTLHCIALRTVKVNDSASILTAWSREQGCVSIHMPASESRESKRRRALTMPLCAFEGITDLRKNRDIIYLKDVRPTIVAVSLTSNPVKASVAIFLSDILHKVLRETQSDTQIYEYLLNSSSLLDKEKNATSVANFHIYFLINLARYLGIYPDTTTYAEGSIFDMREGRFVMTLPLHRHYLNEENSRYLSILLRIKPRNLHHYLLNRHQRAYIIENILHYYTLHHTRVER